METTRKFSSNCHLFVDFNFKSTLYIRGTASTIFHFSSAADHPSSVVYHSN